MEKKNNKISGLEIVIIVLIACMVLGLGGGILYFKVIRPNMAANDNGSSAKDIAAIETTGDVATSEEGTDDIESGTSAVEEETLESGEDLTESSDSADAASVSSEDTLQTTVNPSDASDVKTSEATEKTTEAAEKTTEATEKTTASEKTTAATEKETTAKEKTGKETTAATSEAAKDDSDSSDKVKNKSWTQELLIDSEDFTYTGDWAMEGTYSGEWEDGKPQGSGVFLYSGYIADLQLSGRQKEYIKIIGNWENGVLTGKAAVIQAVSTQEVDFSSSDYSSYDSTVIYVGKFSHNKAKGSFTEYKGNSQGDRGMVITNITFQDGVKNDDDFVVNSWDFQFTY